MLKSLVAPAFRGSVFGAILLSSVMGVAHAQFGPGENAEFVSDSTAPSAVAESAPEQALASPSAEPSSSPLPELTRDAQIVNGGRIQEISEISSAGQCSVQATYLRPARVRILSWNIYSDLGDEEAGHSFPSFSAKSLEDCLYHGTGYLSEQRFLEAIYAEGDGEHYQEVMSRNQDRYGRDLMSLTIQYSGPRLNIGAKDGVVGPAQVSTQSGGYFEVQLKVTQLARQTVHPGSCGTGTSFHLDRDATVQTSVMFRPWGLRGFVPNSSDAATTVDLMSCIHRAASLLSVDRLHQSLQILSSGSSDQATEARSLIVADLRDDSMHGLFRFTQDRFRFAGQLKWLSNDAWVSLGGQRETFRQIETLVPSSPGIVSN